VRNRTAGHLGPGRASAGLIVIEGHGTQVREAGDGGVITRFDYHRTAVSNLWRCAGPNIFQRRQLIFPVLVAVGK
jgi:hypothetical protein